MEVFNSFYQLLEPKEQKKFKILFEDKTTWYVENQCNRQNWDILKLKQFDKVLELFIKSQSNNYDLSYICFPMLNFNYFFPKNTITGNISFKNAIFYGETYFVKTIFNGETNFSETIFLNTVSFNEAVFNQNANFNKSVFESDVIFKNASFLDNFDFREVDFRGNAYLNAENMSFNLLDIKGTYFEQPLLLGLSAYENKKKMPLGPKHFANKESARLIKDHFEKQNNITEANKYFVIEQDKYIKELRSKENRNDNKRITKIIPLYLNKWISNFGTNWVRAIIVFMIWGIVARSLLVITKGDWELSYDLMIYLGLWLFVYFITYKNTRLAFGGSLLIATGMFLHLINASFYFLNPQIINEITIITNPINAFKNYNTFKNHEAIGAIIRVVSIIIIYQIIVAFRQNTRRK